MSPAVVRWGLAGMLILAAPADLSSESVTLSTYYPAPSGVYTQLITTGNTYLARDGGAASRVGIGTPAPNVKLDLRGTAGSRVQFTLSDGNTASAMIRAGNGAAQNVVYASDRGINFRTGATWTNADAGGLTAMEFAPGGNVGIGTPPHAVMKLDVNGVIGFSGGCSGPSTVVSPATCPGGTYSTWKSGVNTHFEVGVSPHLGPGVSVSCCSCLGACPSLP